MTAHCVLLAVICKLIKISVEKIIFSHYNRVIMKKYLKYSRKDMKFMDKNNRAEIAANRKSSALWAGLSFVVPAAVMLVVLAVCGITPFGGSTLISDANSEWFSGFCRLYESVIEGESVLYHFNTGFGSSFYSEFVSQLCSPFMFAALFFSSSDLAAAYSVITVLRTACAGLFAWLTISRISGGSKHFAFALSCGYALCGFAACAVYYPSAADCLVFFPLLVMGIYRYVNESRYIYLFAFGSMFFIICSRMTVAAIVISFVFYAVFYFRRGKKRQRVFKLAMFAAMLLCSAATAAILLIPAGASAVYYRGGMFSAVDSMSIGELLSSLFFGGYGTVSVSGTYYFCLAGLLIMGTAAFMLNGKIKLGERMSILVGIIITLLSAVISPLGTLLFGFCGSGGEIMNMGFVLAVIAVYCTARNFAEAKGTDTVAIAVSAGVFAVLGGLSLIFYGSDVFAIIAEIGLAAVFIALFVKVSFDRAAPSVKTSGVIAAVTVIFGVIHYGVSITGMENIRAADSVSSESAIRIETAQKISDLEFESERSMSFFRYKSTDGSAYSGVDLNANQIEGFAEFMHAMGVTESDVSGGGANFTPLTDVLFSVRYEINGGEVDMIDYSAFSPAYLVDRAESQVGQSENAFEYQNNIAWDWFGVNELFTDAEYTLDVETTSAESEKYKWTFGNETTAVAQYSLKLEKGETLYVLMGEDYGFAANDDSRSEWHAACGGGIYQVITGDGAGEVKIYICRDVDAEEIEPVFMTVSESKKKELVRSADKRGGEYISRRGNTVKFMLNCSQAQTAVTSIPYEYGWEVTVNGERVDTVEVRGGLIGIELDKGSNSIVMEYRPPLFTWGMAISIIMFAIGLYIALYSEHEMSRRRRVRMAFRAVELNLEREKSADIGRLMQENQQSTNGDLSDEPTADDSINTLSDDEQDPYDINS